MRTNRTMRILLVGVVTLACLLPLPMQTLLSQPVWPPPPSAMVQPSKNAQRAAVTEVRSQANWLLNATRTAPGYATGGAGLVWNQFQSMRQAYSNLGFTLFPRQREDGANQWAELSAGLDILQEAFANYENDLAGGRPEKAALRDLCSVLGDSTRVWLAQFNQDCARLTVGY